MNSFNDSTVLCTKKRLFLLFMLDVSDWVCTLSLIATGVFEEANPLMKQVIAMPALGFLVKVALPFVMILAAVGRLKYADEKQVLISNRVCLCGVVVYVLINIYHIFCFAFVNYFIG